MAKPMHKAKTAANAMLFLAAAIGATLVGNVVASRYFHRFDMTSEKVYTLSKGSRDLVKNLPDRMNVKIFMSEDLKPPFKGHAQFVRDLLDDYATYSEGKLNVELIKIGENDTKKEEEASKYHIQKSRRGVLSTNKVEIGSTYLGVAFDYHGQIESIPVIEQPEGLEFEISGLIKQMTVHKKKIAFASSEGEPSLSGGGMGPQHGAGLQLLEQQLKKSGYDTLSQDLKNKIPDDVDALMVIGPKQPMSERAKYVVDQFLMKGKSVAFFVDGETMSTPRGMMMPGMDMPQIAQPNDTGLDDILGFYGIKVKSDMVLDKQNYIGPVTVGQQVLGINHPVFMLVGPLDQNNQITQGIEAMILPYASSVELTGQAKDNKGLKVTLLAESSKQSWRPSGPFVFDPQQNPRNMKPTGDMGPFPLAYSATGKFKSFFAGKQIVKEDGTKVDGNLSQPGVEPMITESPESARLVVVGDSDFINDQYAGLAMRGLQAYIANVAFTLNVVDWLAQDEALAQVRNKGMQNRPLKQVSEGMASAVKALNIVGVPLAVCLFGLLVWLRRRSARHNAVIVD